MQNGLQMRNDSPRIPPPLLEKLNDLRPLLEVQGVVQRREKGWRLRYRNHESAGGGRFHKSINLGSDSGTAMAVASLLEEWRFRREKGVLEQAQHSRIRTQISKLKRFVISQTPKHKTGRPRKASLWYCETTSPNYFLEKLLGRFE